MKRLLALLFCLLPLSALGEELPLYQESEWAELRQREQQYIADLPCFSGAEVIDLGRDELLPVYASPSEEGWRGAKGRAAVNLAEPFTALAWSEDGQWLLIDYQVDGDSHRIGYICPPEDLVCEVPVMTLRRIPATVWSDSSPCFLTDDPNGSQREVAAIEDGDALTVLGWTSSQWAYVETRIDGKPARLFLNLSFLSFPSAPEYPGVMREMEGVWVLAAGGSFLGEGAVFDGVGRVHLCGMDEETGALTWQAEDTPLYYAVYPNQLGDMRYPGCPYVLEVGADRYFSRGVERFGLRLTYGEDHHPAQLDLLRDDGEATHLLSPEAKIIEE